MSEQDRVGGAGPERDAPGGAGDVDRYLDEMFDRLAGTGAAGRRALAETEDHLRASVADETARGLSVAEAERSAVTRFGPPARIAAQLRRTQKRISLRAVLSGVWLVAGLATLVLALTYLGKALELAVLLRLHPQPPQSCILDGPNAYAGAGCSAGRPVMYDNIRAGLLLLVLAVIILMVRWQVVRRAGLAPTPPRFSLFIAILFAVGGIGRFVLRSSGDWVFGGRELLGVPAGAGLSQETIAVALAMLTSIVAIGGYLTRSRRAG